jgi:hypothetical protein
LNPLNQTRFVLSLGGSMQIVFPNAENAPLGRPQSPRHQNIARLVAGEFIFPKCAVAFRLSSVFWTTMPETTVHKDCQLEFWKYEIRSDFENSDSRLPTSEF